MATKTSPYGLGVTVSLDHDAAVERTRQALSSEGFGVLTEIDLSGAFRAKLGVDFRQYTILGACNPALAHQAVSIDRDIGLLLPCNIIVYQTDEPGTSVVAALDPVEVLSLAGNDAISPMAAEVRGRLERVLHALAGAPPGGAE